MVKDKERGGEVGEKGWSEAEISPNLDNVCLENGQLAL